MSQIPHEVLHQIVLCLPPATVLAFQQACRKFNQVCGPLLWRQICIRQFRYWNMDRRFSARLALPVDDIDWKRVYSERHMTDAEVNRWINSILASQPSRIEKTRHIVEKGNEAKDTLLKSLHVEDEADDVLARRWYSGAALSCLHRSIAIEQWLKLRNALEGDTPLEMALGAFDMFTIQDEYGDLDDISTMLDRIADHFRQINPEIAELTARAKAIRIVEYVRAHNLVGIGGDVDAHYHDLQNNFIGKALKSESHPSLPLISVAIYCSIAQRLGVDARPCGFPFHVLAIIYPPQGQSLDGRTMDVATGRPSTYLDPFRSEREISVESLKSQLTTMGVPPQDHAGLLGSASTDEIVARCARNIVTSFREFHGNAPTPGPSYMKSALYAALWALLLLPKPDEQRSAAMRQAQYLPVILNQMESEFPQGKTCKFENVAFYHHTASISTFIGLAFPPRIWI